MLKTINTTTLSLICLLVSSPSFAESKAHESSGGGLPQFDPTSWPSQLFWLAIFFTILYFVFGKSIIPSLENTIETRTSYIADHIKKAEALSAEAAILQKEINQAMKTAGQTANSKVIEAESEGKEKLSAALINFRSKYEQNVAATEDAIEKAKKSAMIEMEKIVVSLASQAAEKIAGIPAAESGAEDVVKSLGQSLGRKVA